LQKCGLTADAAMPKTSGGLLKTDKKADRNPPFFRDPTLAT
jgi:hypothetical protein